MAERPFIYGRNPVAEMLRDGRGFEQIILQKGIDQEFMQEIKHLARATRTPVQLAPFGRLNRVTRKNHQGVIAFTRYVEYRDLEDTVNESFEKGQVPLVAILDRITDVRNLGAIARSAEVLGATAIVVPVKESAMINEDAVKTSAGAIMHIPVCKVGSIGKACRLLESLGLVIYAADQNAEKSIEQIDFDRPCAFVLGSEHKGVHPGILRLCSEQFSIPQQGKTESLNVSVAAGVILYESARQRKQSA